METSPNSTPEKNTGLNENKILNNGTEEVKQLLSFPVLDYVNEIRFKHGIRLEEYSRFRNYCSKKLHIVRKQLKPLPMKTNKYVHEEFPEVLNDSKYLEILTLRCDRAWSHGMELKSKCETSSSSNNSGRHYYMRKFAKAHRLSVLLEEKSKKFGDSATANNAKIYRNFMEGFFRYEQEKFEEAHGCLSAYSAVMEQRVRSTSGLPSCEGYNSQLNQLKSMIKLCTFHMKVVGKTLSTPKISQLEDSNAELILVRKTSDDNFIVFCRGVQVPLESKLLPQKLLDALNSVDKLVLTDSLFESLKSGDMVKTLSDEVKLKFTQQDLLNNYEEVTTLFGDCTGDVYTELMSNMDNQDQLRKLEVSVLAMKSLLEVERHVVLETLSLQDLLSDEDSQLPLPKPDEGIRFANILKQQLSSLIEDQNFGREFLVPNEVVRTVNSLLLGIYSFRKGDFNEGMALVHWSNSRSQMRIDLPNIQKNRLLWRCLVCFDNLQAMCSLVLTRIYPRLFAIFARSKLSYDIPKEDGILDLFGIEKQLIFCRPLLFDLAFIYYEPPELPTGARFKGVRNIFSSLWN